MIEPTPIAEPLDNFLQEVIKTLHTASGQGLRNAAENPELADKNIRDCKEMLDIIMTGHVEEWIGKA
jgi:hypothetical protein